ncbi:MAG TPA: CoA transferase, partial [Acidimicrobiales bacterium]|nr:CoA transferase [Acidimicrobiales bacterium]
TTISGFGARGPYAGYKWSDLVAQLAAWATLPQGRSEDIPVKLPALVGLCTVGQTAAMGALAGVLRARASGAGAHVDCAAYEALGAVPSHVGRFLGWEYGDNEPLPDAATSTSDTLFPMGVFPCGDGYVSMMSTPQQLPEMLAVLDDNDLREAFARPDAFVRGETKEILDAALYPWLLSHTRAELTELAQTAGWPFAGVNTPAEVLEADHLHQRGFWVSVEDPRVGPVRLPGPPYRHGEGGWQLRRRAPLLGEHDAEVEAELGADAGDDGARAPVGSADPGLPPLRGVRVLDLTTVWSGPYLTLLLADLGAEVIRLENPSVFPPTTKGYLPRPDQTMMELGTLLSRYARPAPGVEDRPYNRHALNNSLARNKLSCTLDPRRPEARELFMRLVRCSDVFVENLKASTLHRLGIQESELMDANPRLIVMRIPPAGLTGDWRDYTGFGQQFDGLTGFAHLTGHHDCELVDTPSTTYMDGATGPPGVFALMAALHYRESTGRGQIVELAQMDNVLNHLGDVLVDTQLGAEPERTGNRDPARAPQGVYAGRGEYRWLGLTVTSDEEWLALTGVMNRPDLGADERLATVAGRFAHHDELDAALREWVAGQDVVATFQALQAAGVAAAPQLSDDLLVTDPNVSAREWVRPLTNREVGTYRHIGHAVSGLPQVWWRGSPSLGEDNEYVYRKLLGLEPDVYERLVADGIIVNDYLDADGRPV